MEHYPGQPGEPERLPDMEIAPLAPPDADTRDGVAYRQQKWQRIMEADAIFREARRLADLSMGVEDQQTIDGE